MLGHCRRRWTSIKQAIVQRIVFLLSHNLLNITQSTVLPVPTRHRRHACIKMQTALPANTKTRPNVVSMLVQRRCHGTYDVNHLHILTCEGAVSRVSSVHKYMSRYDNFLFTLSLAAKPQRTYRIKSLRMTKYLYSMFVTLSLVNMITLSSGSCAGIYDGLISNFYRKRTENRK